MLIIRIMLLPLLLITFNKNYFRIRTVLTTVTIIIFNKTYYDGNYDKDDDCSYIYFETII